MAASVLLALEAGSAFAVKTHPFLFEFSLPQSEPDPLGLAVNETTHHVYVGSFGFGSQGIYNFDSNGQLDPTTPKLGGPAFEASGLAVDNGAGASAGTIYAAGRSGPAGNKINEVQQYSPSGVPTAVTITAASIPPAGTPQGGGLPPVVNDGAVGFFATTVDGGNVYVIDRQNAAIDEFTSSGVFAAQYGTTIPSQILHGGVGLARDSAGNFYVGSSLGLFKLDSSGNCPGACVPLDSSHIVGVALGAADSVVATVNEEGPSGVRIVEFDPAGALTSTSGANSLVNPGEMGLATDVSTGRIYVGDQAGFPAGPVAPDVKVFGPTITLPDATTGTATNITGDSATLNGTVGADGGPSVTCAFQYVTESAFQEKKFEGAASANCVPGGPFTGEATTAVHADLNSLNGGTTYRFRLVGTNSTGATAGEVKSFTTHGPVVKSQSFAGLTETSATLEATLNPNGGSTTYRFEYVDQAQFAQGEFDNAIEVPAGEESIGEGSSDVKVSQTVGGLIPGTGYHFRVVATNAEGESFGPNLGFVTFPPPALLPDDRAYEQVSPTDKNGANIQAETDAVQAAARGGAITYFSNAGLPVGGEGAQDFPSYLATRTADGSGWISQGLMPPASAGPLAKVVGWNDELTNAYSVAKPPTEPASFYQRHIADRSLTTIASSGPDQEAFKYAGESDSGAEVLFENSTGKFVSGAAAGKPNPYVWNKSTGQIFLAGALNNEKAPAKGSFAGPYDWFHSGDPTSPGGAAALYYTSEEHAISQDGSKVFFTAGESGQLYVRLNPTEPQSPMIAGKCASPSLACTVQISSPAPGTPIDPNGEQPAAFIGATPDGDSAFFLSSQKLTANATTGTQDEGMDLYRYDLGTGNLIDLTVDGADSKGAEVQGVLGLSADGSYVYIAANGVLAPGGTPGSCKIGKVAGSCNVYLIHGSVITFVARLSPALEKAHGDLGNWAPTAQRPETGGGVETAAARVSADGQTLLFRSSSRLTAYDNRGFTELYRYRVGAGSPVCVSCNPTLAAPTGSAALQNPIERITGPKIPFGVMTRNLSADGNRIFFETPDRLVTNDINGVNDVYEWEAPGSSTCQSSSQNGGCLFLISSGTSPLPSEFGDASSNGNDVFFLTAQSLVEQDRDELVDLYDARVGGGIPSQNPGKHLPCSGEGCSAPPVVQPSAPPIGTGAALAGNPKPLKCKKGFKKVVKNGKERCERAKHHKKHKKHKKKHGAKKKGGQR